MSAGPFCRRGLDDIPATDGHIVVHLQYELEIIATIAGSIKAFFCFTTISGDHDAEGI